MTNPTDSISGSSSGSQWEQARQRLYKFFQNDLVKEAVSVIVPGTLAAVLFPFFGPLVAAPAAAVAIQNGLKAFGISFSSSNIEKMLKPLEGKQITESDVRAVVKDLLPSDKQFNDEAAKALVQVTPEVKKAALANSDLDAPWLSKSLETSMQQQGNAMAEAAPKVSRFILLDGEQLLQARDQLLANWSLITQEVSAKGSSNVNNIEQGVEGTPGGPIKQGVHAEDHSTISGIKQNTKLS